MPDRIAVLELVDALQAREVRWTRIRVGAVEVEGGPGLAPGDVGAETLAQPPADPVREREEQERELARLLFGGVAS